MEKTEVHSVEQVPVIKKNKTPKPLDTNCITQTFLFINVTRYFVFYHF